MKFKIEQIAIAPRDPAAARKLLEDMGAVDWTEDHVKAGGKVYQFPASNEADLSFNYTLMDGKEFEIIHYTKGVNWIQGQILPLVSHFGMHAGAEEIEQWRKFFADRAISVVQEVYTSEHSNPAIADNRRYHYVIFGTSRILGVDIKLIERINH